MKKHRPLLALALAALTLASGAYAEENLTDLDLATLMSMDVTVTSASRRAQAAHDAAAAVFVITREDIRRSPARSIPDLLRQVPGVQVARIDSRSWAVTARGFNSRFANKLLVMVDGRSIYSPIFSGVFWEEQAVALDNIERIEIVRGPGGALWGANAMNGVINIITRSAQDTAGLHVDAGAGTSNAHEAALRFGAKAPALGDVRVHVGHSDSDPLSSSDSAWRRTIGGVRLDRKIGDGDLTLQAEYQQSAYHSDVQSTDVVEAILPLETDSGYISSSWSHPFDAARLDLCAHYGWIDRASPGDWDESALGFDGQLNSRRIGRHLLALGGGVRRAVDEQKDSASGLNLVNRQLSRTDWGLYAQDEIHFLEDQARLIVGLKLEHFEFTGFALQPTLRGIVKLSPAHTLWAAASRAVRTPSRFELDSSVSYVADPLSGLEVHIDGDRKIDPEVLRSYELGWRWRPDDAFMIDLALYRSSYEQLIRLAPQPMRFDPGAPPRGILALTYENAFGSEGYGAELVAEWRAHERVQFAAQATWRDVADMDGALGNLSGSGNGDPKRAFLLRARLDLLHEVDLDLTWRAVSELPNTAIDAYDALDLRLGWQAARQLELALTIENALNHRHVEHFDELAATEGERFERAIFASARWQWRH